MTHLVAAFCGFMLAGLLVLILVMNQREPLTQPLSNQQIIEAVRDCETMGLNPKFKYSLDGRPISYRCGT